MKMRFFSFIRAKDNKNKDTSRIVENGLFFACILCFIVLILVQIVLIIPNARNNLNLTDKSIGIPLNSDEYLYDQGQITLKMLGEEPDPMVRILINGDVVAMFENTDININVKDGDVVEIDGSQSLIGHIVKVESASTNIKSKCTSAVAKVETNLQSLVKIQFN
jgi:hypothetical protein